MSDMISGLTVNGKKASSRCPVTVSTLKPAVIRIVAPDGKSVQQYTFNFTV
jgi:hypothetical protein